MSRIARGNILGLLAAIVASAIFVAVIYAL
jgi:hypothetical protein